MISVLLNSSLEQFNFIITVREQPFLNRPYCTNLRLNKVGRMTEPLIEFKNVTKRFGNRLILDRVDLQIYANRVTTIIGKIGAGIRDAIC